MSRPAITPEYLEKAGEPTVTSPAEGIIAIISGDGYETVDMTYSQAEYVSECLLEWIGATSE